MIDVATRVVRRLGPAGDWQDEEPQWSPDGTRVAFSSTRGGSRNFDIFVMQADGSGVTRLTDHPAPDQDPAWAADGKSLFFTSERNGRGEIYRVWIDSRKVDRLTSGLSRAIMPAASRDGRYMAYAAQLIMGFRIQLVDLRNGQERTVGTSGGACRPAFSPDTHELAFVHLDAEPSRLEAVTETSRRTLVADRKLWSVLSRLFAGWALHRLLGEPRTPSGRGLGPGDDRRRQAGHRHSDHERPRERSRAALASAHLTR